MSLVTKKPEVGPDGINPAHLPIAIHERMLGVDITIHAAWIYREMHGLRNPSGFTEGVDIRAVGSDKAWIDGRDRRYIAEWARRTLFRVDMARVIDRSDRDD